MEEDISGERGSDSSTPPVCAIVYDNHFLTIMIVSKLYWNMDRNVFDCRIEYIWIGISLIPAYAKKVVYFNSNIY